MGLRKTNKELREGYTTIIFKIVIFIILGAIVLAPMPKPYHQALLGAIVVVIIFYIFIIMRGKVKLMRR